MTPYDPLTQLLETNRTAHANALYNQQSSDGVGFVTQTTYKGVQVMTPDGGAIGATSAANAQIPAGQGVSTGTGRGSLELALNSKGRV